MYAIVCFHDGSHDLSLIQMQTYPLLEPVERPHLAILHIPQKVCQSKALNFMKYHALTSPLVNSKHAVSLIFEDNVVIAKILFTDLNYTYSQIT